MTDTEQDGERQSQLLRGVLDMCLLALLGAQPSHGYELVQRIGAAGFPSVGYGTIYPLLTRMRRLGLLTQEEQAGPHGPARKVYALTPTGRTRLHAWNDQWHDFTATVARLSPRTGPASRPSAEPAADSPSITRTGSAAERTGAAAAPATAPQELIP